MITKITPLQNEPASYREEFLHTVIEIITKDRNSNYGSPMQDFSRISRLVNIYLTERKFAYEAQDPSHTFSILPHDIAVIQILLKISRLVWSPDNKDSWIDIAGYAACGYECTVLE